MDALLYPFTDITRFLRLYIFTLGAVLLVPIIYANGYGIKITRSTFENSDALPEFKDTNKMIEDGFKYFFISIVYGIPVFIIDILLLRHLVNPFNAFSFYINPVNIIIMIIVSLIFNIIIFIAIANFAYTNKFKAAFKFKYLFRLINNIGWKEYIIYIITFTLLSQLLTMVITFIITQSLNNPILNLIGYYILSSLVSAYMIGFAGRLRGLIYPKDIKMPISQINEELRLVEGNKYTE